MKGSTVLMLAAGGVAAFLLWPRGGGEGLPAATGGGKNPLTVIFPQGGDQGGDQGGGLDLGGLGALITAIRGPEVETSPVLAQTDQGGGESPGLVSGLLDMLNGLMDRLTVGGGQSSEGGDQGDESLIDQVKAVLQGVVGTGGGLTDSVKTAGIDLGAILGIPDLVKITLPGVPDVSVQLPDPPQVEFVTPFMSEAGKVAVTPTDALDALGAVFFSPFLAQAFGDVVSDDPFPSPAFERWKAAQGGDAMIESQFQAKLRAAPSLVRAIIENAGTNVGLPPPPVSLRTAFPPADWLGVPFQLPPAGPDERIIGLAPVYAAAQTSQAVPSTALPPGEEPFDFQSAFGYLGGF